LGISLRAEHVKRYKDLARLFMKYGRAELVHTAGLEEALDPGEAREADPGTVELAQQLAKDLEALGPTFVKLGQILSTRADLLPQPVLDALSRLQDGVGAFPYEQVEETVRRELGVRISKAFAEFDPQPIAAASLGQVHRARLRDGREVAVKVQRPDIRQTIVEDLEALSGVAEWLDKHSETGKVYAFAAMLEEFKRSLLRELDYRQEGRNLAALRENLRDFERIVVPAVIEDYSTATVLTTEYLHGQKVTAVNPVVRTEIDGRRLADELFRAYLQQILVDGLVHADPHPGNVFLTDDNRVGLIDLGQVARLTPSMQESLLQLLLAVSEGRSDEAAGTAMRIGTLRSDFDEHEFRRRVADVVGQLVGARVADIQVGRVVMGLTRVAGECGIRVPPELTMLGKALLSLDEVGRALDPDFDPNDAIRRHSAELTRKRMLKAVSPGALFEAAVEMKDFVQKLPGRVNRILDTIASNQLEVKVDAIDEQTLMDGFQKVANRITVGLVTAALIVGAALLMKVETSFRILGYPGLAMLCFVAAAGMGFTLVLNIVLNDRRSKKDLLISGRSTLGQPKR
jgi:predicted unusual protein kinase regulating ubiquinone biosynthesis (AarF/ABC1/UbiB family)